MGPGIRHRIVRRLPSPVVKTFRAMSHRHRIDTTYRWEIFGRMSAALNMGPAQHAWLVESGVLNGAKSLFSIGPAHGTLEFGLVEELGLELGYAEPHAPFRDALEAEAARRGLASRIVERHAGPYRPSELTRQYDAILSSGSWYNVGYDRNVLRESLDVVPKGVLVITLVSSDDFFAAAGVRSRKAKTTESFSGWLDREGVAHKLDTIEQRYPIELLIKDDELTELGRETLAFFTFRPWEAIAKRDKAQYNHVLSQNEGFLTRVRGMIAIPGTG